MNRVISPRLTKRSFLAGSAALGLGAGAARAEDMPAHERELYEAAKKEGELTWYSGQLQAEPGEAVGHAFSQAYPGIKVNVVRSTSQVAYQRLSQDMQAGVAQCDFFSSTDYGHYLFLKREGKLLPYRPHTMDDLIPEVRNADPDNMFQVLNIGLYLIATNTRKVQAADAPKSWKDLTDPKWLGQEAVGHPGYSGAVGVMAVTLQKLYGWDFFTKLEKNKPQVGRSADDPVTLLNAGERTVGMGVSLATTLLSMSRGNPLSIVYPTDGTLAVYCPSAIPKNAPHPNAAKLFMEFTAGQAYAKVVRNFFIMPLRTDVPPPDGALPFDKIKLISATPKEIEDGIPEVKEKWRDTFGV
ncbi:MAG: extracellular solute-binding protein [Rhodopila sp.]|nr:extracellular solute-binding protein [Rhodopila sp.]